MSYIPVLSIVVFVIAWLICMVKFSNTKPEKNERGKDITYLKLSKVMIFISSMLILCVLIIYYPGESKNRGEMEYESAQYGRETAGA